MGPNVRAQRPIAGIPRVRRSATRAAATHYIRYRSARLILLTELSEPPQIPTEAVADRSPFLESPYRAALRQMGYRPVAAGVVSCGAEIHPREQNGHVCHFVNSTPRRLPVRRRVSPGRAKVDLLFRDCVHYSRGRCGNPPGCQKGPGVPQCPAIRQALKPRVRPAYRTPSSTSG